MILAKIDFVGHIKFKREFEIIYMPNAGGLSSSNFCENPFFCTALKQTKSASTDNMN